MNSCENCPLKEYLETIKKEVETLKGKVSILELKLQTNIIETASKEYRNFMNSPENY